MKTSKIILLGAVSTMAFGGVAGAATTIATKDYVDTHYRGDETTITGELNASGQYIFSLNAGGLPGIEVKAGTIAEGAGKNDDKLFWRYVSTTHTECDSDAEQVSAGHCDWAYLTDLIQGSQGEQGVAGANGSEVSIVRGTGENQYKLYWRYLTTGNTTGECADSDEPVVGSCGWTFLVDLPRGENGADADQIQLSRGNTTDTQYNLYWRYKMTANTTNIAGGAQCAGTDNAPFNGENSLQCGWMLLTESLKGDNGDSGAAARNIELHAGTVTDTAHPGEASANIYWRYVPVSGDGTGGTMNAATYAACTGNDITVPDTDYDCGWTWLARAPQGEPGNRGYNVELRAGTVTAENYGSLGLMAGDVNTDRVYWRVANETDHGCSTPESNPNAVWANHCQWQELAILPKGPQGGSGADGAQVRIVRGATEATQYTLYWRYQTVENTTSVEGGAQCANTDNNPVVGTCGWALLADLPAGEDGREIQMAVGTLTVETSGFEPNKGKLFWRYKPTAPATEYTESSSCVYAGGTGIVANTNCEWHELDISGALAYSAGDGISSDQMDNGVVAIDVTSSLWSAHTVGEGGNAVDGVGFFAPCTDTESGLCVLSKNTAGELEWVSVTAPLSPQP